MNISRVKSFILAFALACTVAGASGTALAAPPASVAGTVWTLLGNRDFEQLTIDTQSGPGAPGAATCRRITGTLSGAQIIGWYCPATGRIHFRHNNKPTHATVRVFTGNVSDDMPGAVLYMGGTMAIDNAAFGDLGEYNFGAKLD